MMRTAETTAETRDLFGALPFPPPEAPAPRPFAAPRQPPPAPAAPLAKQAPLEVPPEAPLPAPGPAPASALGEPPAAVPEGPFLKTCAHCGEQKPPEKYPPAPGESPGDRGGTCRKCRARSVLISANKKRAEEAGTLWAMNEKALVALFEACGWMCLCCEAEEDLCVDHVIPMSKRGADAPQNVQILCRSCNSAKASGVVDYRPGHGAAYLRGLGLDETLGERQFAEWNRVADARGRRFDARQGDLFSPEAFS